MLPLPTFRRVFSISSAKTIAVVLAALLPCSLYGQEDPGKLERYQPKSIPTPMAGSISGTLHAFDIGTDRLAFGSVSVPLKIDIDQSMGKLLFPIFPSYSPDSAASAWGNGFRELGIIQRINLDIEVQHDDSDDLSTPWGRFVLGNDGSYYSHGIKNKVRIEQTEAKHLVAFLPDGTTVTFRPLVMGKNETGYTWFVSSARSKTGETSHYYWRNNGKSIPVLEKVLYGGRSEDSSLYRIDLNYLDIPEKHWLVSYGSGKPLLRKHRVVKVTFSSRIYQNSDFNERWHYRLTHERPRLHQSSHFLTGYQKVYASGAKEPEAKFRYDYLSDHLTKASYEVSKPLTAISDAIGSGAMVPNKMAIMDFDRNGYMDFESSVAGKVFLQSPNGEFTVHEHEIKDVDHICRPYFGSTVDGRHLGRIHGRSSDLVSFVLHGDEINICTIEGKLIEKIDTNVPEVNFHQSGLVDINRDGKLDIIAYYMKFYDAAINTSTADKNSFRYISIELEKARSSTNAWFLDINGDGHIDILGADQYGLEVFYGKGQFEFEPKAVLFGARDIELIDINKHGIYFADVNKDGLMDLYASRDEYLELFINEGSSFAAAGLRTMVKNPDADGDKNLVVASLGGSQSSNLVIWNSLKIKTLDVNRASTGLMIEADDGKGSILTLSYELTPPDPASGRETIVLSGVEKTVTGKGSEATTFGYQQPVHLGLNQRFAGFKSVSKKTGGLSQRFAFDSNELANATLLSKSSRNKIGLERTVTKSYQVGTLAGLNTYLLKRSDKTITKDGSSATYSNTTEAWDDTLCPTQTTDSDEWGSLTKNVTYTRPGKLAGHLGCFASAIRYRSGDSAYPLDWTDQNTFNDLGQLTKKQRSADGTTVTLYELAYDDQGRLAGASTPDQGQWQYDYYSYTPKLMAVTDNLGVIAKISAVDEQTGLTKQVAKQRSKDHSDTKNYQFDDFERLQAILDSQMAPLARYGYDYPTRSQLGSIQTKNYFDSSSVHESYGIKAADGGTITTIEAIGDKWQPGAILKMIPEQDSQEQWLSGPFSNIEAARNPATLLGAAHKISTQMTAKDGTALASYATVASGIQKDTEMSYQVAAGSWLAKATTNGSRTTTTQRDSRGRIISYTDELGYNYQYRYDAAGRPRQITLPSGAQQNITYDGLGRIATVTRSGVGALYYRYNERNQVYQQELWDSSGTMALVKNFSYDAKGRIVKVTHSQKGQADISYSYHYDGEVPEAATISHQRGLLTSVMGQDFRKVYRYDSRGRKTTESIRFFNGHNLERQYSFYRNDALKTVATQLVSNDGKILDSIKKTMNYSPAGRLASVTVNDTWVFSVSYDGFGRIKAIASAGLSDTLTPSYDSATFATNGQVRSTVGGLFSFGLTKDKWDHIDGETYSTAQGEVQKSYAYNARGHLTGSGPHRYDYDADGLIRSAGKVTADSFGRLSSAGQRQMAYGPDGQLRQVVAGDATVTYSYDENHQLISRRGGGEARYFYEGTRIRGDAIKEDLEIAGFYLGYVTKGDFTPVFTDPRGTPVVPDYSPFGLRQNYTELSENIDYARFGRDPVSGLVRMGVRHYAPELGRFTTPDLLFLQNPTLCLENPVGCNLYSYGRNNPLSFTDPTGLCARGGCGTGQYLRYTMRPLERAYNKLAKAMATAATGVSKIYDSTALIGGGITSSVKYSSPLKTSSGSMGVQLGYTRRGFTGLVKLAHLRSQAGGRIGISKSIGVRNDEAVNSEQGLLRLGSGGSFLEYTAGSNTNRPAGLLSGFRGADLKLDQVTLKLNYDSSGRNISTGLTFDRYEVVDIGAYLEFAIENEQLFDAGSKEVSAASQHAPRENDLWDSGIYLD